MFGLVSALGYDSIPLSIPNPADPTKPPINININLNYTDNNPQNLYNAINALPMVPTGTDPTGVVCAGSDRKDCRLAPVVSDRRRRQRGSRRHEFALVGSPG